MSAPMSPDAALARLRQYEERPAPTWSTASYGGGATESALAAIGRTLADEVERLRAELDARPSRAEVLREAAEDLRVSLARTTAGKSGDLAIVTSRLVDMADQADSGGAR